MRNSACFISIGGDSEDSAVGIFAETTNQVERGVREVKNALFNHFKAEGWEQIMNMLEVEYFERNHLVHKYIPNISTSGGAGCNNDDKMKMEMNIPAKRTLTTEYSMDVDIGNFRLMLPGTDFYHLRSKLLIVEVL